MIESLEDLLEQHAWAALRISGADQSAWNGEIIEAGQGILGLAHWDGTLHLDREFILEPLRELYEHPGSSRTDAELLRCRDALITLLHEQSHFLGPSGATQKAAHKAFKLPGGRALEEGVAEAWAHEHLDDYIRELEIDKVAPGILEVRSEPSYAAFVPAVRLLTADIDRRAGLSPGETLTLLNRQTAEGQWPQAVTLIYNATRLPQLVPTDEVPAVRLQLEESLRNSFKSLELYEPFPRGFAASRSHSATTRLLTSLHHHLSTTERDYTPARQRTHLHLPPPTVPIPPPPLTPTHAERQAPPLTPTHAERQAPPLTPTHAERPSPPLTPTSTTSPHALRPAPASAASPTPRPTPTDAPPSSTQPPTPVNGLRDPHPAPTRARPPTPVEDQRAASADSSQTAAIRHAFAGIAPPAARPQAPSGAPPRPAPATPHLDCSTDLRTVG